MSTQEQKQRPDAGKGDAGEQAQFVPVDVEPTDELEKALADAAKVEADRKAVAADNARRAADAAKIIKAEQDRAKARQKVRHACCCC